MRARASMPFSLCIAALALAMVTGCTVGPDFRPPKLSLPQAWRGTQEPSPSQASTAVSEPNTLIEWWTAFNDSTLTSLVQRAIRSNLDVRQALARIRQARAARGAGAAALWPTIDANSSYRRSRSGGSSSGPNGGSGSAGGRGQDLFQVGLDSSWELDFFGGNRRNIEALEADLQASVEDSRDVLVTLVAEVGVNYVNLRGLQQQILIARRNLDAQRRTAEITRQRFEAGFVSGLDQANADAQAATTASQIPLLESSVQDTIYGLSLLLGEEPTYLLRELEADVPIPVVPPDVPVGLPSDLIRRRPDIRRAEAQIHAATSRIGVATAELLPKFSLTGSFGYTSLDLASLLNPASQIWSIGPTVTWRIFDAGRTRSNIEVQNALQEQALLGYEKAVLSALRDVESALSAYAKEQGRLRLLDEAVANNRKAVQLAMELYTAGQTDFLNVLTAQRSLFTSEDALVQSTRSVAADLIALYKALGGGWEKEG